MNDKDLMPFGKYKGKQLVNVPARYLLDLLEDDCCTDTIREYILDNQQSLELERKDVVNFYSE